MRNNARAFVERVVRRLRGLDPVYEFGSLQVPGQEGRADLRPFFPGRPYVGCDLRKGRGVDRILNVEDTGLPDASAGTVLCVDTFEHVKRPWDAAREMVRILKPDGLLIVATCFNFPIHNHPSDYWRFTPAALRLLFVELSPGGLARFEATQDGVTSGRGDCPVGSYFWGGK